MGSAAFALWFVVPPQKLLNILEKLVQSKNAQPISPELLLLVKAQVSAARSGKGHRWPPRYALRVRELSARSRTAD